MFTRELWLFDDVVALERADMSAMKMKFSKGGLLQQYGKNIFILPIKKHLKHFPWKGVLSAQWGCQYDSLSHICDSGVNLLQLCRKLEFSFILSHPNLKKNILNVSRHDNPNFKNKI